ncbi:MAG: FAD synthetase family protein [Treponema sp.]
MEIFFWEQLQTGCLFPQKFPQGTAISIGGFDGPHRGHQHLLKKVLAKAQELAIPAGVITFSRSPRVLKQQGRYGGDVSTLRLRLQKFEEYGFAFTVLIDFSEDFAKINGTVFFDILMKTICIRYLAVGSDFTCGYRRDTGVEELRSFAHARNFCFDSIDQLYSAEGKRISSTAIRHAVECADFTLAKELLGYSFFIDVKDARHYMTDQSYCIDLSCEVQILPPEGLYYGRCFLQTGIVCTADIAHVSNTFEIMCNPHCTALNTEKQTIERIELLWRK